MTLDEAAEILRRMRREAKPRQEMSIQAILFGIKYHKELRGLSLKDISSRIGVGPETCSVEIRYGMRLAQYVELKESAM